MKSKLSARCLLFVTVLALAAAGPRHNGEEFDAQRYLAHVKFLAAEGMHGRATGSPKLEKAAAYIAKQFKADGLPPVDGKNYLLAFPVTTNAKLGTGNHFVYTEDGKSTMLKFEDDFIPFNFSFPAVAARNAVFLA